MKPVRIILCGCGGVGKAFLGLLAEKAGDIEREYGIKPVLQAAVDLNGAAVAEAGQSLDPGYVLAELQSGKEVQECKKNGKPGMAGVEVIRSVDADVLVEMTPTNLVDGEPGTGHVLTALGRKREVVSANKGPFVLFYGKMLETARLHGCRFHISAAAAAALPTLDVGTICLSGARVESIEGILNGTSNYILTKMRLEGVSYEAALTEAQRLGIAETNPAYDVEGKDSANKMVLIVNRLFSKTYTLADISVVGMTQVTGELIDAAAAEGKVIKLLGTARPSEGEWEIQVAPVWLVADHPLASVNYSEKAITYRTDTMGDITVMGGKSSPLGAAAAALKDMINAFRL
jgi:homoserine dehydrogenase